VSPSGDPIAQARVLIGVKRAPEAVKILRRALASDPEDGALRRMLGWALLDMDRPQEALVELDRALALEPEDAGGHDYRAWALHGLHRKQDALRAAQETVRLEPHDPAGLRTLCVMQLAAGQVSDADATANLLRAIEPNGARAFDCIGLVRMEQGKADEAVRWFRAALAVEPNNQAVLNNLARAQLGQNKMRQGLKTLGEAVRVDPANPIERHNLFLVSQLYLGWFGLLVIFLGNVATQAVFFHRFNWTAVGFGFFVTTVMIVLLRYWRLMRMDRVTRRFHLAEVKRARRAVWPLAMAALGIVCVAMALGFFLGLLDGIAAASIVAAAFSTAILFGVVLPWPAEYLPWARR
jgi:Flp pilus assembly protein TadD